MQRLIATLLPILWLAGCAMTPAGHDPNQQSIIIHRQNSTQLEGCKRLGAITTDTYGNIFNFMEVADRTFMEQARYKYGAEVDSIALVNKEVLPAGHVIMQGIAYKCFG